MKIAYLIDVLPNNGGAPISTQLIANSVCRDNDVTIIMPSGNFSSDKFNPTIRLYQMKDILSVSPSLFSNRKKLRIFAKELKKAINAINPDIVHVQMPPSGWMVGFLLFTGQIPKSIKYIYHDRMLVTQSHWVVQVVSRVFIRKQIKNIVCLTDAGVRFWSKKSNKVFLIPNVAGELFEEFNSEKIGKNEKICITFVGRVTAEKNWPLTEQVIHMLKKDAVKIIIVVQYSTEEQKQEYLQMKNRLSGVTDVCYYENLSQEQLSDIYYKTDIFVMTSKKESFGRTAVEAMSRKCVVIGTDVGGIPYVIGKEENVVQQDAKKIYDRIAFYLTHKQTLEEDKEWFFERQHSCFSTNHYVKSHLEMYKELV